VSHRKRLFSALVCIAGILAAVCSMSLPALAQSVTPSPSPIPGASPDNGLRLIIILIGSLVAVTAVLAGVIIYMLKMFKHRY